jgi:beta-lactamase class A
MTRAWRWAAVACGIWLGSTAPAAVGPDWRSRLQDELRRIDAQGGPQVGVYVRDLDTGSTAAHRADTAWYLASLVKVPVAIAVLRAIERQLFGLDTLVTLRASDYVDGAGTTNLQRVGAGLSVRSLLEQMIIHSDNTASDMLIGLVGVAEVNAVVQSIAPGAFGRITLLAEVRRATYARLVPAASRLEGHDLIVLRRPRGDDERLQVLARLVQVPVEQFDLGTLEQAYAAYYASGLNAGRLDAYGELMAQLADGQLLSAPWTAHLLGLMERTATGPQRLKAGLPPGMRLAHKTGTQRARFCDAGLVRAPRAGGTKRVVIVACTQGERSLAASEYALRRVSAALCRSGLLTDGVPDAPHCPVVLAPKRLPGSVVDVDVGVGVGVGARGR